MRKWEREWERERKRSRSMYVCSIGKEWNKEEEGLRKRLKKN